MMHLDVVIEDSTARRPALPDVGLLRRFALIAAVVLIASCSESPSLDRAEALLVGMGRAELRAPEGRCAIEAVAEFDGDALGQLENVETTPSPEVAEALRDVFLECEMDGYAVSQPAAGASDSGSSLEAYDLECVARSYENTAVSLVHATRNTTLLELPDGLILQDDFAAVMTVFVATHRDCISGGTIFAEGLAMRSGVSFTDEFVECLNRWFAIDDRLVRLFGKVLSYVDQQPGMAECLTVDEYEAWWLLS
ncbi:MAG: hypothetical protein GY925_27590 [Actinomycetia bacterium]|nr:hypothetical protein [Actinomycetes bacterium]